MKRVMSAMLLLAPIACDDGDAPVRNVTSIKAESAYVQRLRDLSEQNRDLALRRAIQDAGQRCPRIESSEETGVYKNMASWTARCEGGGAWAIFIAPNGDVQVRSCGHVEQLGLPACKTSSQESSAPSKE